jgi:hypothetical protein
MSLYVLSALQQAEGDATEALAHLSEALMLYRAIGDRLGTAWCLEALAGHAIASHRPRMAASFLGAATGLREAIQTSAQPSELPGLASTEASARTAIGDEAFLDAWSEGRATIEKTISSATVFTGAAYVPRMPQRSSESELVASN